VEDISCWEKHKFKECWKTQKKTETTGAEKDKYLNATHKPKQQKLPELVDSYNTRSGNQAGPAESGPDPKSLHSQG